MKRAAIIFCIVLMTWVGGALAEQNEIGTIKNNQGEASIVRGAKVQAAEAGTRIQLNDQLKTGPDGSLGIVLDDDTVVSLGPDSSLVVDKFIYAPAEGKLGLVTKLAKGTAVFVSGQISKMSPDSAKVETPLATIGIRGTRFCVRVGQN